MNAWIYRMMAWRRRIAGVAARLVRLTKADRRRAHWHPKRSQVGRSAPKSVHPS
jgi:hypothetical protein